MESPFRPSVVRQTDQHDELPVSLVILSALCGKAFDFAAKHDGPGGPSPNLKAHYVRRANQPIR